MTVISAYTAEQAGADLTLSQITFGPLKPYEVEIKVEYCGICHSDLSMIDNEWGASQYPLVAGHEIIGRIVALGDSTRGLQIGQRVGVGWTAESCQHCDQCISGHQNLCGEAVSTIGQHYGGFAERVRASWEWVIPLPDQLDPATAGPLLCGGITVFNPLIQHGILPYQRVGVIGIGGLGHLAIGFAHAWGCHVTAFSSDPSKADAIRAMGADAVVDSRDDRALQALTGQLDLLIVCVNVPLNWDAYLRTLAPQGRLHMVGAVLQPIPVPAFSLISGQKSVAGSPTGSPSGLRYMMRFAAQHQIAPTVQYFPMSQINDALKHVREGKARYRVVLQADFDQVNA